MQSNKQSKKQSLGVLARSYKRTTKRQFGSSRKSFGARGEWGWSLSGPAALSDSLFCHTKCTKWVCVKIGLLLASFQANTRKDTPNMGSTWLPLNAPSSTHTHTSFDQENLKVSFGGPRNSSVKPEKLQLCCSRGSFCRNYVGN